MFTFFISSLSLLLLSTAISAASNGTCYYPNGDSYKGQACSPNADVSACCGPAFICLSNGLCEPGPDNKKTFQYKYYRSGCTDASWASPECPNYCTGAGYKLDAGEGLQSCGNNRYCCRENYDCCTNQTKVFRLGDANVLTTIPSFSGDADSTSFSTSPSATTIPNNSKSGGSSNRIAIGVGVGVGVGAILIVILAVFILLRRRRNKRADAHSLPDGEPKIELEASGSSSPPPEHPPPDHKEGYAAPDGQVLSELEDERKARIPKEPQELEHQPRFEIGRPPSPQPRDGGQKPVEFEGQLFGDGVYRHEAP